VTCQRRQKQAVTELVSGQVRKKLSVYYCLWTFYGEFYVFL